MHFNWMMNLSLHNSSPSIWQIIDSYFKCVNHKNYEYLTMLRMACQENDLLMAYVDQAGLFLQHSEKTPLGKLDS